MSQRQRQRSDSSEDTGRRVRRRVGNEEDESGYESPPSPTAAAAAASRQRRQRRQRIAPRGRRNLRGPLMGRGGRVLFHGIPDQQQQLLIPEIPLAEDLEELFAEDIEELLGEDLEEPPSPEIIPRDMLAQVLDDLVNDLANDPRFQQGPVQL